MMNLLNLDENIVNLFTGSDTFTGYEIAKRLNIRPQMVYNYIGKGFIASVNVNGQRVVEANEAVRWATKYLTKKNASA